ncbi:Tellurite resistance protein TehB [Methylophaga frappieri]|uniref:Tellurite resistance protein TehB n=1 Tax=Methylophaga frappieri (strain ATCC BAA-2434 / DSM 25690 / JAM7) TaxID=754477 RepID=I1YHU0_METFJ|nr:class I SAM-dependent methyltransferase [Methylophaga frappieri]AFJ02483.1 Tellurite resistance protein TehB [Methylophaga frappieri]
MWDERYSGKNYAYGTEPNDFLKEKFSELPKGNVLCLAEGEGRNAVFLAEQGFAVTAVDLSAVGLDKARSLAASRGVPLILIHADLAEFDLGLNQWDGIVSIFCALPSPIRRRMHKQVVNALKPGGSIIIEAYTPQQVENNTGGGKDPDQMQTILSLKQELSGLSFTHLIEKQRDVNEGIYHTGLSAIVQAIAFKDPDIT